MGATPQLPRDDYAAWQKGIEAEIALLHERLNNPLANTGLSVPGAGVVECDGTFNVVGTENVSGNLNVTGGATIGGPTTISGLTTVSGSNGIQSSNYVSGTSGWKFNGTSLEANTGVIGDGALANPVRGDSAYASASNFALTTTGTTPLVSQSWYTPTGFTIANVLIAGRVFAYNSTASLDYLYARSRVYVPATGVSGYGTGLPLAVSASGGSGLNSSPVSIKVENLTDGQEIRLEIQGWTNTAGWAANAGNTADVAGQIIWTR